jgi:hypothetical protein
MSERNDNRNAKENSASKPDPGTTHTTDPQENMEGPVSSLMHNTGENFDTSESKEDADDKKDRKM